ncbi:DNA-directed DNA polymerase alpha catalytic subunit pol1 [Yamadazyma tenuis]|uniref:DNA polymerase n=1 Tax=Candida tenuis (strain ATCC 10573 / BCRC 21748 / CBS 615 / JCM 9827 / NBRC 10315 / NRRL Y-1498 / VKM Y-70) TaxID=590646 RepID=G3BEU1_CANTC|nr:uncharacterized protein CANTEDRAFT_96043 [Yamadazyma tenuis ATCC 10573]EGV60592.1 hypothetical protein CANTEDRAFT_96043 [Yamadazyma tenuis ATCC 10573]WEJ94159.1 DNA-directed DNA polymerase alpha catalytic subunit pol1 [Yamadazyma tenuis]
MMSSKNARREKLKLLKQARELGRNVELSDQEEEAGGIYDEVDEDTFRQHKRNQMMNDDFIVDDDGEGYVDNGADEWDDTTRPNYYSDEEEDVGSKRKRTKKPAKVTKTSQINNFFKPKGFEIASKPKPKVVEADIDDILNDFDDVAPAPKKPRVNVFGSTSSVNRNKPASRNPFNRPAATSRRAEPTTASDDSSDVTISMNDQPSSPIKTAVQEDVDTFSKDTDSIGDIDDESDEDDIIVARRPRASAANRPQISNISAMKAERLSSPVRNTTSNPDVSYVDKLNEEEVFGGDNKDSFKMFWMDHCEVDNSLILFGKVQTRSGQFVSGAVQINGLTRELFFLPRKYRKVGGEDDTEDEVSPQDVHEEIIPLLLDKYKLDTIRAKPEKMKYAFELTGVPKESDYLKVLLPFKTPKNKHLIMPADLEGETFSHVFGTNSNIFEAFVVQRNIMGPCWLEISKGDFNSIRNSTHCQVEVSVDSPNYIKPLNERNLPPPNLTLMSIAIQTVMNAKQNKQEVASVSIGTYRNLPQDAPIDENLKPDNLVTLVRPVNAPTFPPGLNQLAQKQGLQLRTFPNEKALLNCLSGMIKSQDPDIFIGHRLENISLDVLVHRMYDLKVSTWSNLGRRNRKAWPDRFGKGNGGFNNNLQIREVFHGRLLCDIANELGQSLTPKCQSWDLPEMYDIVCHKEHSFLEVNYNNNKFFEDTSFLLMALNENASSCKIAAEIAFSIQILSLSKQLTNLAGNAWSQTLYGTRAGRNEYILLHEFHKNKFICPDKEDKYHKNTSYAQQARLESTEDDATNVTSNKKPKFQGGLVFEPEKGLHKNCILVMDFNSLYPSIIQEFNICFTTVERERYNITHDEDKDLPSLPENDLQPGVLPKLLNTLVSRRREVKKLLKDPKNTPVERAQYDIKQQALKLTANSMYGCLGYVNSRFYAKPLAMLVTNKGREILMDTRQLAESIGLRVVYGDTDSVMIDTGVTELKEAIKTGNEFKAKVNERYKILEIDIDNTYKAILLHAKKKYAAMDISFDKRTGKEVTKLEVKGLDMRRREYCQLSKDISTFILNKVLLDADSEKALSEIYEYLEQMANRIKNNEIPMDKFKINTKLSKDPTQYPNAKSMAQVQVALRMREQGKVVKAGSVITYVVTAPVNESDTSSAVERARSFQETMNKAAGLRPDPSFYLEKQIFAPVERLLERIDGIDMVRVAGCLSIDTSKYILRVKNGDVLNDIAPIESSIGDSERFRSASHLLLKCKCGHQFRFGGIQASHAYKITFKGIACNKCQYTFSALRINSQLETALRNHISTYYGGWLVCDDGACGITTRQISVYGKRCIGSSGKAYGCKGVMRYKYSDKALYNQLLYFDALFDVDKAKNNKLRPLYDGVEDGKVPADIPAATLNALTEQNRDLFGSCQQVVQKYLEDCGRRYVDMGSIFDFMNVSKF